MLQLQQEDILKAARGNAFTNSLLNQQKKVIKAPGYTINLLGATFARANSKIMYSGRGGRPPHLNMIIIASGKQSIAMKAWIRNWFCTDGKRAESMFYTIPVIKMILVATFSWCLSP